MEIIIETTKKRIEEFNRVLKAYEEGREVWSAVQAQAIVVQHILEEIAP